MLFRPDRRCARSTGALLASCLVVVAVVARAEDPAAQHHHQTLPAVAPELSPASKAYETAMETMHKEMSIPYTNDVDVDFVRGMLPHHQGAIDQALVLLKYSKNPRLRRLAGGIIAAQRREQRFMLLWLKEHDQGIETTDMPQWLKTAPETVEEAQRAGTKD